MSLSYRLVADLGGWGHHMDGWGWGGAVFGWLIMVLIALAIVWLVWSAVSRIGERRRGEPSPRDLLDRRYARGEITREEYLQQRSDLGG